jgi:hypothetical protein
MTFDKNVFINCPFDTEYKPLLRPLIFTIVYLGLEPKISETTDSAKQRVISIQELITQSKYSIHDLSRIEVKKKNTLPRFNMPFELGLDIGCKQFGQGQLQEKRCLILEKEQYRYQKVLSDISGNDIEAHKEDAQTLIRKVRNWFFGQGISNPPSPTLIWNSFNEFESSLAETLRGAGYNQDDIEEMPKSEFISFVKDWVQGIKK